MRFWTKLPTQSVKYLSLPEDLCCGRFISNRRPRGASRDDGDRLSPKTERDRSQGELEPVILDQLATVPDIRAYFVNERGERASLRSA